MRTRQRLICVEGGPNDRHGGRFRCYGWPATLELLRPVDAPPASHRHFRMTICPSCLTVHETGGKCPSSQ